MLLTVFLLGAVGGLLSGMLGVGGAVILLPLLTTFTGLSLKQASGITVAQVVASALVSWAVYRRGNLVHLPLAIQMGIAGAAGAFAAGYASGRIANWALEWTFLSVVLAAIVLLLLPFKEPPVKDGALPGFNPLLALGLGLLVGVLAGLLGTGGGFLAVPLMIGVMRLPTRLAIGTSSAIILISASFGLAGKLLSGLVRPDLAAVLVLGAAPTTYLGAWLGQRLPPHLLQALLVVLLSLIAAHTAMQLLWT